MVLVANASGTYVTQNTVAPQVVPPVLGSGATAGRQTRRSRRRNSGDPTAWSGLVREQDDEWWRQRGDPQTPSPRLPVQDSRRGSRRSRGAGHGGTPASFYEPNVVEIFKRKATRSVSPFSHEVGWKHHRAQSPEVQLVRQSMSPRAETRYGSPSALYDRSVVVPFLKHKRTALPKLSPVAPEPEPEPEPASKPHVSIVAQHGNYLPEPIRPASPPAVVQAAFIPADEMAEEARARKELEALLRKLFRMTDYRGTGLVSANDMANMDWLISESTGHATILSTTERTNQMRGQAGLMASDTTLGVSVGEFIYTKLQDIKARSPWWADLAELYRTASDELRAAFELIDDIKAQQMRAKAELEDLWALAWKLCDADADGSVTLEECVDIDRKLARSAGRPFNSAACTKKFEQVAANEAGHMSMDAYVEVQLSQTQPPEYIKMAKDLRKNIEHCIAVHERQQKFRVELVSLFRKVFVFCDWQRDGMVSQDECISLDRQIWSAMRREVDSFDEAASIKNWMEMDTDGSGGVDEDEFVTGQMKPISPESYEHSCTAVAQVLADMKEARKSGHKKLEDLFERAFISFDWSGTGTLAADIAQQLDDELHKLPTIHRYFVKENVKISPVGLQLAELRNRLRTGTLSATEEKKTRRQLQSLESDHTPFDAADFVLERLGALPPDAYHEATSELEPCVREMELARVRQEDFHRKLLAVFEFAFELCDTGGDGEVSMQECILLDSQIAQVLGEPFDEQNCQHSWREMDANNDGSVSRDEYVAFQMRNFGPMQYEDAYDGISYVLDAVDELRCACPCAGVITVSVRCIDLAFSGSRQDSRIRVSNADAVFVSETQSSTDSPVFPEIFRFSVVAGEVCKLRIEVLSGNNEPIGQVASVRCGRMLGGDWTSKTPVRRQFELLQIGRTMGQSIVSMQFTSTATLRPPGPGALCVSLVECKKLVAADSNGLSDPYVTLRLGTQAQQRSVTRPKTLNPVFQQTFFFLVDGDGKADDYRMSVVVVDSNKISPDVNIGTITIDVGNILGDRWTSTKVHKLALEHTKYTSSKTKDSAGCIHMGLQFIPEAVLWPPCDGVLTAVVTKCQHLAAADMNGLSDPYCELQMGNTTTQKTRAVKKTLNPEFDVTLKFEIYVSRRSNPLNDYMLRMRVLDKDTIGSDDLLGTTELLVGALLGEGWSERSIASHKLCPVGTVQLDLSFVDAALLRPPCSGLLVASLIRASAVVPADDDGLSDPYANLYLGDAAPFKSRKMSKTLDPCWLDEYRFPVTLDAKLDQYRLHVQLKDHDMMSDDSLGSVAVDVGPVLGADWSVPVDEYILPISDPGGEVPTNALAERDGQEHKYGQLHLGLNFIKGSVLRPECDGLLVVSLIRAVDLVVADSSGSSDPFAHLSLGAAKPCRSRTIEKCLNPLWGGDDFRFTVMKEGEFSDWRLKVVLMDQDKIGRNDHLGALELDIGTVLRGKQWRNGHKPALYSLRDREGKVSSSAMKGREGLAHPWGRVELALSFVPLAALKPPEPGLLIVTLYQCMDLPAADSNGLSDSFVSLALGSSDVQKSRVFEKERDPVWGGDEFRFNVSQGGEPTDWRLLVVAMDHDKIGRNDHLGTLEIDIGPETRWKRDCAKSVYGLRDREGKVSSSAMKGREGLAHPWGRVELALSFVPLAALKPPEPGLLIVTLYQCMDLPAADSNGLSDSFVSLALGSSDVQKSRVFEKERDPVWGGDEFRFNVSQGGEPTDWRLLVVAMDHDKIGRNDHLGTLEIDIGPETRWKRDCAKSVYGLRDREGKVSSSAMKGREGLAHPWGRVELALSFLPVSHLKPSGAGLLTITLIRGSNLLSADRNGLSDPFVLFTLGATPAQKSRVIPKSVNPVWNSKQDDFLWSVSSKQVCTDWTLKVHVFDHDTMGSNDSLGHFAIDMGLLLGKGWLGSTGRRKSGGEAHGEFELRDDGNVPSSALKRRGQAELDSLGLGSLELAVRYTVQG